MKKGFTILELLVASLLLGMLVTILTMMFNQSSIAWRTGVAGVADLDDVRQNIAALREESDSLYVWNNRMHRLGSLWDDTGVLCQRAISGESSASTDDSTFLAAKMSIQEQTSLSELTRPVPVGSGSSSSSIRTYIVNVKCAGPDRVFGTWDDIWSFPDDFE